MRLTRPHTLPLDVLRARVEALRERLSTESRFVSCWTGDILKITGAGFKGVLQLLPGSIELEAQLGILLRSFTAQIEAGLALELDQLVSGPQAESAPRAG